MRASDSQDESEEILDNASLNETAHSIHIQSSDLDKQMQCLDNLLQRFIRQELALGIKLDGLDCEKPFQKKSILLDPVPKLYFLHHSILVLDRDKNIQSLRNQIEKLNKSNITMSYFRDLKQLQIKLHNNSELVYYNIRTIEVDASLHKTPVLFDSYHLIDKLFEYYATYYQKLYFSETASLMLYWAYQKDLLNDDLGQHAIKLLVICIFINFSYGVPNVIYQKLSNPQSIKEANKMIGFARINSRGETQIDKQLVQRYREYTIQEKRGFYMHSRKGFMKIKDIIPIQFPIVPLSKQLDRKERETVKENISAVLENQREKMSICKNLYKIFKFLHNKFDKKFKLVIDFQSQNLAYRQEFSENFQVQILHPVLGNSICKIKDHLMRRMKSQINLIHSEFKSSGDPLKVIIEMLTRYRR